MAAERGHREAHAEPCAVDGGIQTDRVAKCGDRRFMLAGTFADETEIESDVAVGRCKRSRSLEVARGDRIIALRTVQVPEFTRRARAIGIERECRAQRVGRAVALSQQQPEVRHFQMAPAIERHQAMLTRSRAKRRGCLPVLYKAGSPPKRASSHDRGRAVTQPGGTGWRADSDSARVRRAP